MLFLKQKQFIIISTLKKFFKSIDNFSAENVHIFVENTFSG
jgi:hypothetical protein